MTDPALFKAADELAEAWRSLRGDVYPPYRDPYPEYEPSKEAQTAWDRRLAGVDAASDNYLRARAGLNRISTFTATDFREPGKMPPPEIRPALETYKRWHEARLAERIKTAYPTSTLGSGAYLNLAEPLPRYLVFPAIWIREGMYFAVSPWRLDPACDDFVTAHELLQGAYEAAFGCDRYPGL